MPPAISIKPFELNAHNHVGSDLSGTDGTANRTLTIVGVVEAYASVIVNGRVLHPTNDYTVSGSVITFLVVMDDTDTIRVIS